MAEGILDAKTSDQVMVDSAGTSNYHIGDLPDRRSIDEAKKHGLDITDQRGRQFSVRDFDVFDRIYVMDNANYRDVVALARNDQDKEKVSLILEAIFPGERVDVPDPYQGGPKNFEKVYHMLDEACKVIAKELDRT
ncbi:low molecular weight protein-tyrosine-phosphatase [Gangjinia marincola]|uniref:protein-tyrosine-phosphatase n=1 Tax=Gangjinia marincola TaxID=578463 RepID=A0ABN1MES0_9FLAO